MTKITDRDYNDIAYHMQPHIKDWAEYHYAGYDYEILISRYYLRLLYECGQQEADEFDDYMFCTYGYDVDDYVSRYAKECAILWHEGR